MPAPSNQTDFTSGNSRGFRIRGRKTHGLVPMPDHIEVQWNNDGTNHHAPIGEHANVPVL